MPVAADNPLTSAEVAHAAAKMIGAGARLEIERLDPVRWACLVHGVDVCISTEEGE
jgi:hypothetical protein